MINNQHRHSSIVVVLFQYPGCFKKIMFTPNLFHPQIGITFAYN